MTNRINHVAEAKSLLPRRGEGGVPSHIAAAQVHATLALVEQQRIANELALLVARREGQIGYDQLAPLRERIGL